MNKLEKRVENLENLVYSLIKKMNRDNFYKDADINGVRHSSGEGDERLQSDIDFIAMETGVDIDQGETPE